jgi:hypothetical protein
MSAAAPSPTGVPGTVLIATPVKNAARYLDGYFANLSSLAYPPKQISLAFLESDSDDDTFDQLRARLAACGDRYRRSGLWQRHFGFRMPPGLPRWVLAFQISRRRILAKSRNHLLARALDDEDWVLWLDVDVVETPPDLIQRLLAGGRDIVHPHCVTVPGGTTFDRNGWRDNGRVLLEDLRGGEDLVRLDSVGGTVLLIRADLHRDGLMFPPYLYGREHRAMRRPGPWGSGLNGEIETEGLGLMAADMGYQCWGMPNLEVRHASKAE